MEIKNNNLKMRKNEIVDFYKKSLKFVDFLNKNQILNLI